MKNSVFFALVLSACSIPLTKTIQSTGPSTGSSFIGVCDYNEFPECVICFEELTSIIEQKRASDHFSCAQQHPVYFCALCLEQVDAKRKECPLCRAPSKNYQSIRQIFSYRVLSFTGAATLLSAFLLSAARAYGFIVPS